MPLRHGPKAVMSQEVIKQSDKNLLGHLVITPHILESFHFGHFFSKDSWFASLDHGFGHLLHMISVPLPESPLDHPENCVPWIMVSSLLAIFWNLSSNWYFNN